MPLPAAGVTIDPAGRTATGEASGIHVVVEPSAWVSEPENLPAFVTPLFLLVHNASAEPLVFDHPDLRLFDEARFQYTALPPSEVERIMRARYGAVPGPLVAATLETPPLVTRRYYPGYWARYGACWGPYWGPYWDPWWPGPWGPPYPYGPYYYPYSPRLDGIHREALPVGVVQPGARVQGFAYFPRLRPEASRLAFEFHYRLGEVPGLLRFPLAVERAVAPGGRPAA
jgi:hypothetical protein